MILLMNCTVFSSLSRSSIARRCWMLRLVDDHKSMEFYNTYNSWIINSLKMSGAQSARLLKSQFSENRELFPNQLSGDENQQGTIVRSFIPESKANIGLSVTVIVKTTIGSGIISLPYTMSKLGYVLGTLVLLIFGALNQLCCALLLRSKNLSGHSNYSTIMGYIWQGKKAKFMGSLIIFLDNMGVCILDLIIFKTSIIKILKDFVDPSYLDNFYCSEQFIILILFLIELPLILVKKIERLAFLSFAGVAGIVIFIASVIVHYIIYTADGFPSFEMNAFPSDWYQAFAVVPNIIFAYDFQTNYFPIYKGLRNANDKRMNLSSTLGILACGASYLLLGLIGYSLAGQDVKANFLQSILYETSNHSIFLIINICFILSIACAYPLIFFSSRNNLICMVNILKKSYNARDDQQTDEITAQQAQFLQNSRSQKSKRRQNLQFYAITIIMHIVASIAAMFLDNIEDVINLVGAICQNLIAIILPCTMYFMLIRMQNKKKSVMYYFTICVVVFIVPYGLFTIVSNYI